MIFNHFLLTMQTQFRRFYQNKTLRFVATGWQTGGLCGIAGLYRPQVTGGGFAVIPDVTALHYSLTGILMIFLFRVLTTVICFSSGAPGGIFAPTPAPGTLFGSFSGYAAMLLFPQYQIDTGNLRHCRNGALFAATVRAPLTGIVLVLEMTDNYQLILMQNGALPEKTGDAPRG
ncbi:chloride channel protein [Morganella morganii]